MAFSNNNKLLVDLTPHLWSFDLSDIPTPCTQQRLRSDAYSFYNGKAKLSKDRNKGRDKERNKGRGRRGGEGGGRRGWGEGGGA